MFLFFQNFKILIAFKIERNVLTTVMISDIEEISLITPVLIYSICKQARNA